MAIELRIRRLRFSFFFSPVKGAHDKPKTKKSEQNAKEWNIRLYKLGAVLAKNNNNVLNLVRSPTILFVTKFPKRRRHPQKVHFLSFL